MVTCHDSDGSEVLSDDAELTLPHPRAHLRAFVLVPWWDVEPQATLTVDGTRRPLTEWLAALDVDEREGVRRTEYRLEPPR